MEKKDYLKTFTDMTGKTSQTKEYQKLHYILKEYIRDGKLTTPKLDDMINFTDRIERKAYYATISECYGELLTYYEYIRFYFLKGEVGKKNLPIDRFSQEDQFNIMFSYLLTLRNNLNKKKWQVIDIYDMEYLIPTT